MISNLRLQHFRSYDDQTFIFSPGVNIIVGPNASGKTNLLEAILVVARGSSYRVHDQELIGFTKPWARLDAVTDGAERIVKLIAEPKPAKSYDIAGKPLRRLTLAQQLPIVLFEPNHLLLLSGAPDGRRGYLDDLLEQTTTGYATLRQQYSRTLRQRNALLKRGPSVAGQLFPWDIRLSELAGTIARNRQQLVTDLQSQVGKLYQTLATSDTVVELRYESRFDPLQYESQLLKKLEAGRDIDLARGFTGYGPHREDLLVSFNGHPASETASRGESRTVVLALKILELQLLEHHREQVPLLLLDDVFSELDTARRAALTNYLRRYQTFVTTTDADVMSTQDSGDVKMIDLAA